MGKKIHVLYINAMGPREKMASGGIFVTQRIKALRELGIIVEPVSLGIQYDFLGTMILKAKGINPAGRLLEEQLGIFYKTVSIQLNILEAILGKINFEIYENKVYKKLTQIMQKINKVDLVHLHWMWPVGLGVLKMCKENGLPYVVTCHGSEINYELAIKSQRNAMLNILENAAAVEFVSETLLRKAMSLGYSGRNGKVICNGISTDIFYNRKAENKEEKKVGFVGNVISIKGADRLPAIFRNIYQEYQGAIKFCIIGDGTLLGKLRQQMALLPVCFVGRVDPERLAREYAQMDILVVPSRSEGYPCVIKEAQACGVIPIGNDVGGVKEAIGEYGVIISTDKEDEIPAAFSKAVLDCLLTIDKFDIDQMAKEARKYSWIQKQRESVDLYERILGGTDI